MVVNYDKKNGWTTWLDSILEKTPTVSKEIEDMFKKLEKKPNFKSLNSDELIESAKGLGVVNDNLTEFFKNDKYVEKTFANYQQYLKDTMGIAAKFKKAMSSVGTVFKKIGAAMVTEAVFMAASWAIGKGLEAIDDWIHKSDRLIEKGEKAKQTIADVNSELQEKKTSGKSLIDEYADYIESGKVDVQTDAQGNTTGYTQLTATNEEYEAFLDTNKEIAELFPSLVGGFDSQGNVLLNLGSSAETATAALQNLIEQEERIANFKISQNLQDVASGVKEQLEIIDGKIGKNETIIENFEKIKNSNGTFDDFLTYSETKTIPGIFKDSEDKYKEFHYYIPPEKIDEYSDYIEGIQKAVEAYEKKTGNISDIDFGFNPSGKVDENGIPLNAWYLDATMLEKDADELFKYFEPSLNESYNAMEQEYATAMAENKTLEAQKKTILKGLLPTMQGYVNSIGEFYKFSDNDEIQKNIVDGLNGIIGTYDIANMSQEDIDYALSDFQGWIGETFFDKINNSIRNGETPEQKKKIEEAWSSLLTFDDANMDKSTSSEMMNNLINTIFPNVEDEQQRLDLKLLIGYDIKTEDGTQISERDFKEGKIAEKLKIDGSVLGDLTNEELSVGYDLLFEENFIGDYDQWLSKIKETQETIQEAQKATFSSLLSAEDGDTRKAVDKFEEEAAAIQSAMEKLSSEGRLSNSDWIELQKTLPELAGSTEDLDKVLADLKADKAVKFAEEFGKSVASVANDEDELKKSLNYFADQIKPLELSTGELDEVKRTLYQYLSETMEAPEELISSAKFGEMLSEALLMDFDEYLDLSFNTAYETYTSKMATFTNALEQFKAGTLEGDVLTELYQKVPELAQTTDDLDVALTKLAMNEIGVMLADLNQQIESCIEAGGDVSPLLKLRETITDAVDPSNYTIEELKDQLYAIPEEARDSMSRDDLELAFKLQLETGQAYSDFDKLTQDIETRKVKLSLEMDNMSMFDNYEEALNGLENGDRWDKYGEILKSAKESYDAGDWGEKQFKEAAKLYSYANDSGAANFAENYERFKDFFQEDTKAGAISFLNFLDEYDYAHFDDALNTWVVDIKDFAQDIFGVEIIS